MLDSGLVSPVREDLLPLGSPSSPSARHEVEMWRQRYRYATEKKSLSPQAGAVMVGKREEQREMSPGPGEYYRTHENHKQHSLVGTMGRAGRFTPTKLETPGPGEYEAAHAPLSPGLESPRKGAVFGTQSRRLSSSATTPGPGSYRSSKPERKVAGGTFSRMKREAAAPVPKQFGYSVEGKLNSRFRSNSTGTKGASFGSARRFEGPFNYTGREDVPGPGRYNVGTKLGQRSRSRSRSVPLGRKPSQPTGSKPGSTPTVPRKGQNGTSSVTPGEKAWINFCGKCKNEGLGEDELIMLSLDTLKALMKQVNLTNVVDAARIEVQWKQLRMQRPEYT
eukprot:TRINITY_DN12476_c0_g1_i1.p1 TRINITY_DN12476_c0_g1~~TRINITY_DN12476_c0_g1_i1.p1  ORF type:complete len:335 (+),score=27.92 TRINITY_DN12476_c0_g1_i1:76-1080(+)